MAQEATRHFYFMAAPGGARLEGPLARVLRAAGHEVTLLRKRRDGRFGPSAGVGSWKDWIGTRLTEADCTDLCIPPDLDPQAEEAADVAARLGIRVWRVGAGYFGRGWITATDATVPRSAEALLARKPDGPLPDPSRIARERGERFGLVATIAARLTSRSSRSSGPHRLTGGRPYTLIMARDNGDADAAEQLFRFAISTATRHAPMERHLILRIWPGSPGPRRWNARLSKMVRKAGLVDHVHVTRAFTPEELVFGSEGVVTSAPAVAALALRIGRPLLPINVPFCGLPELGARPDLRSFWNEAPTPDRAIAEAALRLLWSMQACGQTETREDRAAAAERVAARLLAKSSDSLEEEGAALAEETAPARRLHPVERLARSA